MAQKKDKARSDGKPKEERDKDFKFIVRLFNSDINGERTIKDGLTSIPGISYRLSEVLTRKLGKPPEMKIGNLSDEDVQTLGQIIEELPSTFPSWMLNRQKDFETGDDTHVLGVNVDIQHKDDIGELRKVRCYRGIRHDNGHKVRGQRTSSNGRRGSTIGVTRKSK
ncbi:MAG: 30S ribosomal protein S13 [Candidatus Thermoplasmatota archaeon]|nr:30S ribosomal protein S13 [Candidatus Thermoplasmatota archaeon]